MANGDKVQASNLLHLLNTMGPYIWLHVACPTDNVKASSQQTAGLPLLSVDAYRHSCDVCKGALQLVIFRGQVISPTSDIKWYLQLTTGSVFRSVK